MDAYIGHLPPANTSKYCALKSSPCFTRDCINTAGQYCKRQWHARTCSTTETSPTALDLPGTVARHEPESYDYLSARVAALRNHLHEQDGRLWAFVRTAAGGLSLCSFDARGDQYAVSSVLGAVPSSYVICSGPSVDLGACFQLWEVSCSLRAVLLDVQTCRELPARALHKLLLPWTALSPQSGRCKSWRPLGEASLCLLAQQRQALSHQRLCTLCRTRSPSSWRPLTESPQVGTHFQLAFHCSCALVLLPARRDAWKLKFLQGTGKHLPWCSSSARLLYLKQRSLSVQETTCAASYGASDRAQKPTKHTARFTL